LSEMLVKHPNRFNKFLLSFVHSHDSLYVFIERPIASLYLLDNGCGKDSDIKIKDLPPSYRKWLEEEVVYIITPKEKEVFLQLEGDRERDMFVDAFWKVRDPEPSTPKNEFREEHYGRINYANLWFGRGTPTQGWRTDMGRIHIILGEPNSI
ncbi:unnamed protein product, partial [marine sediment metagenome]